MSTPPLIRQVHPINHDLDRAVLQFMISCVKKVVIHSDGACENNPGPGGWAAVLQYQGRTREVSGHALATTNNRMELQGAIEGLRALKEPCEVEFYTDSQYLREGITAWVATWKVKGWKTKERKPVRNMDLWKELDSLASAHKVTWNWLKGHAGHPFNERCDQLAVAQIHGLRARHKPEELAQALAIFREQQQELQQRHVVVTNPIPRSAPNMELRFD